MSKNLSHLSGRKGLSDNLFDRYGQLAVETGSPDRAELQELAREFLMGAANTYGAITFYDFLKTGKSEQEKYMFAMVLFVPVPELRRNSNLRC